MPSLASLLSLAHLLGLALGVGAATVKLALVLRAGSDPALVSAFLAVRKTITRGIVAGLLLATLSGVAWLVQGYSWSPRLVLKVALVAAMFVLGPLIDNVSEPRYERLAPTPEAQATPAFLRARKSYLAVEVAATALMYAALVVGSTL